MKLVELVYTLFLNEFIIRITLYQEKHTCSSKLNLPLLLNFMSES